MRLAPLVCSRRGFLALGGMGALALACGGRWRAGAAPAPVPPLLQDPRVVRLDCTPAKYPALVIGGDDVSRYPNGKLAGFRGYADPCLRSDPESGDLWMAYSWPHVQHLGGGPRDFAVGVETHLARSHDGGASWQLVQVLWPKTPARFADPRTGQARDGFLSHEVPNLVSCRIDGEPAWVAARLDYFLGLPKNYRDRDNLSFCLRVLRASSPPGLASAPYITFGHDRSSPECGVDHDLCDLSQDFPPVFIPNEPALFFQDRRLYLLLVCMTFQGKSPDFPSSFIAVLSTEPSGDVRAWKWRYHGKLAAHREAAELGGEALTQVELAPARDGRLLALLTPEAWDPGAAASFGGGDAFGGILHRGCAVVEVAGLDPPALARRPDGTLALRAYLDSSAQSEQGPGAAGYDAASSTGVVFTLRDLASSRDLSWTLHPTGLHP